MTAFNSIRGRLALISAIVIASVLTLAGIGLMLLFNSYIEKRVAQELRGRVLDVAGAFVLNEKGDVKITQTPSDPRYRNPYSGAYWYMREKQKIILRSRSLWDADITQLHQASGQMDAVVQATGPENSDVYLLERSVTVGDGAAQRNFVIGVALDRTEVQTLSSALSGETALGLSLLGAVLFLGAWLQTSYGLRPLTSIRQQLGLLHGGERETLDGPFPKEVEQLAGDLNALFVHQKDMIARARERAGTLAHGLKTPMTILYGEARKLELSGQTQTSEFIREQLDLIQQQVDRELSRARAHGTAAGIGLHADLSATARRIIDLMQRMPRGADIDWQPPQPGVHLAIDADDCGEILGNLLDNARKWARSTVVVEAFNAGGGKVKVAVSDDGPGIPAHFQDMALERGAVAREQQDSSGLGLAIVSDLVVPYGATVKLETSKLGGACVWFEVVGSIASRTEDSTNTPYVSRT